MIFEPLHTSVHSQNSTKMDLKTALKLAALFYFTTIGQAIIDGEFVAPENQNDFSYVVSIRLKEFEETNYGQGYLCSGALISSRVVLTSAQCVYHFNVEG